MEGYVSKKDVLGSMALIRDSYIEANKRVASNAVQECMQVVEEAKAKMISYQPEESQRVVCLEPFFEGGVIGREVYRCRKCRAQVGKHDAFCKACGRKLVDSDG